MKILKHNYTNCISEAKPTPQSPEYLLLQQTLERVALLEANYSSLIKKVRHNY